MQKWTTLILLFLLFTGSYNAKAQGGAGRHMEEAPPYQPPKEVKRSGFRQILSKVNVGISTGYGQTMYRQDLSGYSVFKKGDTQFLVPAGSITAGRVNRSYTNWLNAPQDRSDVIPMETDLILAGDTTQFNLSGRGQSLPLNLDFHINLADRFKIGAGLTAEIHSIKDLEYNQWGNLLGTYSSDVRSAFLLRYYGMFGVRFTRWYFWDFTADARIGKKNYMSQFDKSLLSDGLYYNFGCLIEHHYSEYFRLTLRPSVEWSAYNMELPASGESVTTQTPAFFFQAGISLNYPRLPRCPINACHAQLEHVHQGKEFRGQPIYRWQNPKYGQNDPELMRNKKRSKDDTQQRLQYKKKRRRGFFSWW